MWVERGIAANIAAEHVKPIGKMLRCRYIVRGDPAWKCYEFGVNNYAYADMRRKAHIPPSSERVGDGKTCPKRKAEEASEKRSRRRRPTAAEMPSGVEVAVG